MAAARRNLLPATAPDVHFFRICLLPLYEPDAAPGVLIDEEAVLTQGETAARDVSRARLCVKLDGILLSGGIDEAQRFVFCLYDVQRNRSSFWRHSIVQCAGGIGAYQGGVPPVLMAVMAVVWSASMMLASLGRTMTMRFMPGVAAMGSLMRGARMGMMVMIVIVAAGE